MNIKKSSLAILLILLAFAKSSYPYAGITHGGITNQANTQSGVIDKYLISIGYPNPDFSQLLLLSVL